MEAEGNEWGRTLNFTIGQRRQSPSSLNATLTSRHLFPVHGAAQLLQSKRTKIKYSQIAILDDPSLAERVI